MSTPPELRPRALTLVTGGSGWLGARLVEALARGLPDVPALARPVSPVEIRCLVRDPAEASAFPGLTGITCVPPTRVTSSCRASYDTVGVGPGTIER